MDANGFFNTIPRRNTHRKLDQKLVVSLDYRKWSQSIENQLYKRQSCETIYGSKNYRAYDGLLNEYESKDHSNSNNNNNANNTLSKENKATQANDPISELIKGNTVRKEKRSTKFYVKSGLYYNPNYPHDKFKFPLPDNLSVFEPKNFVIAYPIYCPSNNEPKPKNWRPMKKNFWSRGTQELLPADHPVGDCMCTDYCDENCLNRLQLFECNSTCCPFGKKDCGNRAFQMLTAKLCEGTNNAFQKGWEIIKTKKKGYGLRTIRDYEPGELIIEYTGDVIDNEEIQRRLKNEYKHSKHYYFLNLGAGLVIDSGIRGSAARFVNHCCDPNSDVEKWTVKGRPRIGLFSNRKIKAGTELSYDYNFRWFEKNSAQRCYCGADNCRGVIGEKGDNRSAAIKAAAAATVAPTVTTSATKTSRSVMGKKSKALVLSSNSLTPTYTSSSSLSSRSKTNKLNSASASHGESFILPESDKYSFHAINKYNKSLEISKGPSVIRPLNLAPKTQKALNKSRKRSRPFVYYEQPIAKRPRFLEECLLFTEQEGSFDQQEQDDTSNGFVLIRYENINKKQKHPNSEQDDFKSSLGVGRISPNSAPGDRRIPLDTIIMNKIGTRRFINDRKFYPKLRRRITSTKSGFITAKNSITTNTITTAALNATNVNTANSKAQQTKKPSPTGSSAVHDTLRSIASVFMPMNYKIPGHGSLITSPRTAAVSDDYKTHGI